MKYRKVFFISLLLLLVSFMCLFVFAQGVGYIQIKCEPGAIVFLDNNLVGKTSSELGGLILQDVPAGSYVIKIVKEGFEPQSVKIDLKVNEIYIYEVKEFIPQLDVTQEVEADTDTIKQRVGSITIGKTGPAGGLIFYDKGSYSDGWRYLEAAPKSTEWKRKKWGSYKNLIRGTEEGIGTGQSNTTKIVAWLNSHYERGRAAQVCDALVVENNGVTYSAWFLPSRNESKLMYENLYLKGVGGFAANLYWSSSEKYSSSAYVQNFFNGCQIFDYKNYYRSVRAVRAF